MIEVEKKVKSRKVITSENIVEFIRERKINVGDKVKLSSALEELVVDVKYTGKYSVTTITAITESDRKRIFEVTYSLDNEHSVCAQPTVISPYTNPDLFNEYFNKLKEEGLLK